ncbi:MAG: efflux RND transporter permease subunit, partial [Candidatus Dadabacteria bacterium]|nr:efflux RND transporter permease subunit [Candidatus Dadabacteria bacterium]
ACAVAISAVNALTLSPALCALSLRKEEGEKWWLFRKFNQGFDSFRNSYQGWVERFTTHWKVVVTIFIVLIGLTFYMFTIVPTGFVPEEDQGYFIVNVQGPEGSSLQRTIETMDEVYNILKDTPGVAHVVAMAGMNMLTSSSDSNTGAMFGILTPWDKRTSKKLSLDYILSSVRKQFKDVQGAVVVAFNAP